MFRQVLQDDSSAGRDERCPIVIKWPSTDMAGGQRVATATEKNAANRALRVPTSMAVHGDGAAQLLKRVDATLQIHVCMTLARMIRL